MISRNRIPTTHVGSLPRNETLSALLVEREEGGAVDPARLAAEMDRAVRHVVEKQAAAGIDIGNDGEQQRVGFQTYVPQRMSGFAGESKRRRGRDYEEFPGLVQLLRNAFRAGAGCRTPRRRWRTALSRSGSDRSGRSPGETSRASGRRFRRMLHDRAFAGHHLHHHAQRVLRLPRGVSGGAGARNAPRI